ncbi:pentapeptide repeat protein [Brevibacillus agri]|nr:pentapeptide repeat protein [Brevibacillus agri]
MVTDQDLTIHELKSFLQSGERHFRRVCVETGALRNADLQNACFRGNAVCGVDMHGANIQGVESWGTIFFF